MRIHATLCAGLCFVLTTINGMEKVSIKLKQYLSKSQPTEERKVQFSDIPLDIIVYQFFTVNEKVDYELIKYNTIRPRVLYCTDLNNHFKELLNKHVRPLLYLAATCKLLNENLIINDKLKKINPENIFTWSLSKSDHYLNYINNRYFYFIETTNDERRYLGSLRKRKYTPPHHYKTIGNFKFMPKGKIESLQLDIFFIEGAKRFISFTDPKIYEDMWQFCEELKEKVKNAKATKYLNTLQHSCKENTFLSLKAFDKGTISPFTNDYKILNKEIVDKALDFFYLADNQHSEKNMLEFSFFICDYDDSLKIEVLNYLKTFKLKEPKQALLTAIENIFNDTDTANRNAFISTCNQMPLTYSEDKILCNNSRYKLYFNIENTSAGQTFIPFALIENLLDTSRKI